MASHITLRHASGLQGVSQFTVPFEALVRGTMEQPHLVKNHRSKRRCQWLFSHYEKMIGQRGDGVPCYWIAVLVLDRKKLITAFPVPSPETLKAAL